MKLKAIIAIFVGFILSSASCSKEDKQKSDEENNGTSPIKGDVLIYTTTSDLSHDFSTSYADMVEGSSLSPQRISIDASQSYQTIHGFGAAITGSSCYNLMQMSPNDRATFLKQTFSPNEGMGYSYVRIAIGCSDFSVNGEYSCCDTKGIENFALPAEDHTYIIPILNEILAINPDLKIMGSPWTPPQWMKVNNLTDLQPHNSWTSGQLNPAYYEDYATYFVKWIQAYTSMGFNITSVTPQNEPLNRGNSASLFMGWQEQQKLVIEMGKQFEEAGIKTKIYAFDHNYNYDNMKDQEDYPLKIYENKIAESYLSGAAYHNYGGNKSELLDIHSKAPDKELVFTETSIGEWNDGRNLKVRLMSDMEEIGLGTLNNWCQAVIVWNLMLDKNKAPNNDGGCTTCYGAVDIDLDYRTITRNSHYYVIGHLAAVIKPGALRIKSSGFTANGLDYAAFKNIDGTTAMVLMNKANENRKITLIDGNKYFAYEVPANAVVSYLW